MAARCTGCGNEIVEIAMQRGNSTFTLQACSTCDQRRWNMDGEELSLASVLSGINVAESNL